MTADCPFADPSVGPQLAHLLHDLMQAFGMAAVPLRGEPAVLVASDDLRSLRVDGHAGPTRVVRTGGELLAVMRRKHPHADHADSTADGDGSNQSV